MKETQSKEGLHRYTRTFDTNRTMLGVPEWINSFNLPYHVTDYVTTVVS